VGFELSGRLFVVAGPSGVGKGTLIAHARELAPGVELATSATTRPPRKDERDGREYHFLSPEEFERRVQAGDFLEHVSYVGNRYGTLRDEVVRRLEGGRSVVLEIEVAGAREIRRQLPSAVFVFVAPPTMADLEARLRGRRQNTETEIRDRLRIASEELLATPEFDHVITNDDVDRAATELADVMRSAMTAEEHP
jgi:guanylate kinase